MDKQIAEIAARTAALGTKDTLAAIANLRTDLGIEVGVRVDSGFDRIDRKLSGLGSTVGSLASAYRTSKATPARRGDPGLVIARAALCKLWGLDLGKDADTLARDVYGPRGEEVAKALNDPRAWLVERTATLPAMTNVAGWAAELLDTSNTFSVIRAIAPAAVYSQLVGHGARLTFSGNAAVRLVNRAMAATGGFFRAEGSPIPVRAESFNSISARTYGGGFATLLSGELMRRSSPNAESVLRQAMAEDAALEIDTVLLGSAAATAVQPAGLLFGATVVTPATITANDQQTASLKDVSALIAAIPAISDPIFIGQRAVTARLVGYNPALLSSASRLTVIASPSVPASTLILIDGDDFWSAENDDFVLDSTFEASVVSADPGLPIVDGAGVAGKPVYSAFQMDLACFRLLCDLGWGMRSAGRVATVGPVAW